MGANAQTAVPTFTASQVLTAAQMNQSARTGVPVFASTVTRDAAFGGTGEKTLAEGQLCYVEGTGLQSYNGTAWVTWGASGSGVIQVKSTTKTDAFTTTSTSFVDVTGLSVSITPTSASNKILVLYSVSGAGTDTATAGATGVRLVRGSTAIAVGTGLTNDFTGQHSIRNLGASTAVAFVTAASHLDSPATTSATTYKVQAVAAAGTFYINRDGDNTNATISTITVMEVLP